MSASPLIYLAGPDVFFPEATRNQIEARKSHPPGTRPNRPLPCDNDLDLDQAQNPARVIFEANKALMDRAEGPHRQPNPLPRAQAPTPAPSTNSVT